MPVRVYQSIDAGAPALRGNSPGDFINLLKKCLQDGYGSKPGAGWTQAFVNAEGTIAAFKQGLGSNGMYLRVDDTQLLSASGYRSARVVGYETMSDLNTGLPSPFPSNVLVAGGLYWSTLYNNTAAWTARDQARPWMLIADEAFFYLYIKTSPTDDASNSSGYYRELYFFGDYISYKSGDSYNTVISGLEAASSANGTTSQPQPHVNGNSTMSSSATGFHSARDLSGANAGVRYGHHIDIAKNGEAYWGGGNTSAMAYPNPADGAAYLSRVWVHQPGSPPALRGHLPGIWNFCHVVTGVDSGDTFNGQGELTGRSLRVTKHAGRVMAFDTTDTWR